MSQKVDELLIEISMLQNDVWDTQKLINEKVLELGRICPHEKLFKTETKTTSSVNGNISEPKKIIYYKCIICQKTFTCYEEDPELEKKVISDGKSD